VTTEQDQFRQAIEQAGLVPPKFIRADGKLRRFSSDGKRGDDAGWYVFHAGTIPAGAFGCWRSDIKITWQAEIGRQLTDDEIAANKRKIAEAERKREAAEKKNRELARKQAAEIWESAAEAPADHAYLAKKGVGPHGLRVDDCGQLVVPVRDASGVLHSLQFIAADGAKRFLMCGRKKGCFYIIGQPNGELRVVEGFATGATVLEDTGHAAAICFDAANLPDAAKELRGKFTDLRFIICADDDIHRPNNPGLTHAREAAAILGGFIAVPDFGENRPEKATDFNDLHQLAGPEAVRACIERAILFKRTAGDDDEGQRDSADGSGDQEPRSPFIMKPGGLS
jgi:putative DNA primase/helicase